MSIERYELNCSGSGRDFRPLYVSRSRCENDWPSTLHMHSCVEIFSFLDGKGFFRAGGQQFPVRPGELVMVGPRVLHTELSFADHPLEYIVLGVEVPEILPKEEGRGYLHLTDPGEQGGCRACLEAILRESGARQESYREVCTGLAQTLLALLRRQSLRQTSSPVHSRSTSQCARIKQHMDEHFAEAITLDTLAAMTHMSKHYLVHAFNKEVGCSPISYLLARRIAESKYLLETSNDSVAQIGLSLGFSSPSYFSQRFKKAVGLTPLDYRRSVRAQLFSAPDRP